MRRHKRILCLLTAAALALPLASLCDAKPLTYSLPDETATLRPGLGQEAAQNNCIACHSVDYIDRQPPGMGRTFWEGVVRKMIKSYHAPINDEDAKAIVDYLAATY